MFYYIRGSLAHLMPGCAVVEAGGVGFKLTVSNNTYDALFPAVAEHKEVKVFTHLAVREDDMELFGFATEQELSMFRLLITVSGVGPKAALSILSTFTPEKFALAVCTDDRKSIGKAPNIGPKTAARIILELHDKMAADSTAFPVSGLTEAVGGAPAPRGGKLSEAEEALMVLGYSRAQVVNALRSIDTSHMEVEEIIRAALKKMM